VRIRESPESQNFRDPVFNLASIDSDYPKSTSIGFDPGYMQRLFEYGYRRGASGKLWQSTPSDFSQPPPRVAGR
jgi:hypothetical protein